MEQVENKKVKKALSQIGLEIDTIYDLVNTNETYPNAIPVLIALLKESFESNYIKEGLIRSLAVKEAKGLAGRPLLAMYHRKPKEKEWIQWAIGNSMCEVMTEAELDEVIDIVLNKNNGTSRQMFVMGLGKFKSEKVENALIELLDDFDVASHALESLGKMKSKKAKSKIEKLTNHENKLIRKEALKALKKIK